MTQTNLSVRQCYLSLTSKTKLVSIGYKLIMLRIVTSPLHLSCNFWRASGGKARTSSSICFIAWFLSSKNEDQNYLVLVWSILWIMWMRVIPFPKIPLITRIYNIWVRDFYSIFTFHSRSKIIPSHDQLTQGSSWANSHQCVRVLSQRFKSNFKWSLILAADVV